MSLCTDTRQHAWSLAVHCSTCLCERLTSVLRMHGVAAARPPAAPASAYPIASSLCRGSTRRPMHPTPAGGPQCIHDRRLSAAAVAACDGTAQAENPIVSRAAASAAPHTSHGGRGHTANPCGASLKKGRVSVPPKRHGCSYAALTSNHTPTATHAAPTSAARRSEYSRLEGSMVCAHMYTVVQVCIVSCVAAPCPTRARHAWL